jgi:hypothetical protein
MLGGVIGWRTKQSSTVGWSDDSWIAQGYANRAIDGYTGTEHGGFEHLTCTHTDRGSVNWWALDMGVQARQAVLSVTVYNRADYYPCRDEGVGVDYNCSGKQLNAPETTRSCTS